MTVLQRIYGETIHDQFPAYIANWPPNQAVHLRTIGVVEDYTFHATDSLAAHDPVKIRVQLGESPGIFRFSTASELSVNSATSAKAGSVGAHARAEFTFVHRDHCERRQRGECFGQICRA